MKQLCITIICLIDIVLYWSFTKRWLVQILNSNVKWYHYHISTCLSRLIKLSSHFSCTPSDMWVKVPFKPILIIWITFLWFVTLSMGFNWLHCNHRFRKLCKINCFPHSSVNVLFLNGFQHILMWGVSLSGHILLNWITI